MNFFARSWENIKRWTTATWNTWFKPLVLAVYGEIYDDLGSVGLAIIKSVVESLSRKNITGKEKFEHARAEILTNLKRVGIEVRDSAINAAIELFVSKLKRDL